MGLPVTFKRVCIAATALCATQVSAQQAQTVHPPKTNLWIDLSTGSMAGMPDMESGAAGGLGGMVTGLVMGVMSGGKAGFGNALTAYGTTRNMSMMPSRVVDIALLNSLRPGVEASQTIPTGMKMGASLPLLPPPPPRTQGVRETTEETERLPNEPDKPPKGRILIYWGCGETVRAGQPRIIDLAGKPELFGNAFSGRYAPERGVNVGTNHALYPNEKNSVNLSKDSSLVGEHQVKGDGVPASMRFTLNAAHDLLPAIALQIRGNNADSFNLSWQSISHAKAYFLSAFASQGEDMVLWSSSETADTGMGLHNYLSNATIGNWLRERILLAPETQQCATPKGIFAPKSGSGGGAMVQMMAYGGESYIVHPPRPGDSKTPWDQEWAVRVRTKSQTMASLSESPKEPDAPKPPNPINLLKGLFGR